MSEEAVDERSEAVARAFSEHLPVNSGVEYDVDQIVGWAVECACGEVIGGPNELGALSFFIRCHLPEIALAAADDWDRENGWRTVQLAELYCYSGNSWGPHHCRVSAERTQEAAE